MTETLRECPFCGSNDVFLREGLQFSEVRCCDCNTRGPNAPAKNGSAAQKAITLWNTRKGESNA